MIPNHKGEIPVALLLLPFLLGILVGINLWPGVSITFLFIGFAVCSIGFILLNSSYTRLKLYKAQWLGGIFITLILFLFGWLLPLRYNELRAPDHFSKNRAQHLVIRVTSEPVLKNGLFRFTSDVEETVTGAVKKTTTGTLLVTIKDSAAKQLNYGDELLIPAKYKAVDPPFNPAEFNYKSYLAHKNIFYQSFLFPGQYRVIKTGAGNAMLAHATRLRQRLVIKLRQNIRDTDARSVASALLLGYKADLSSDVLEAYSKTGTVYVLTVSGAQVAIIYLVLVYLLGFLDGFKHGKFIKAAIIITGVWYYALLTGFSVAVCRAALMLSLVLIGKTSGRYVNTLNILAFSAFLLLCIDPFFITEAGFQLSYLAIFGAIVLRPVVYQWFHFNNKIAAKLWALCSFSIAIQLAIFPLCAMYFHQFPVYFLLSNLLVVVPAAIIMYAGVALLALPNIPVLSDVIGFILEQTTMLMNKALAAIEHFPGSAIDKIWLSPVECLLLYALIGSALVFGYTKRTSGLKAALVSLAILSLIFSANSIRQANSQEIAWLNLKKHPGIVFKNGRAAVVLTDVKQSDKIFKYSVQPYLDSCGISNLRLYDLNNTISIPWLRKSGRLLQFFNTRVFICNTTPGENIFAPGLKIKYIYLSGNPDVSVNALSNNVAGQTFIIDGSNSDQRILEWQKQFAVKGIKYKLLKRNKSFISISN